MFPFYDRQSLLVLTEVGWGWDLDRVYSSLIRIRTVFGIRSDGPNFI